jgi:hypothetical protein
MPALCPHCGQPGIAIGRKLYAVDACPARCAACGGLSYVRVSFRHMGLLLVPEVLAVTLVIGWDDGVLLRVAGAILLLAVMIAYQRIAPLAPISPQRVRLSRWCYGIGWVLILGIIALASQQMPADLL